MSCPPYMWPAKTIGARLARPAYRAAVRPAGPEPMMMTLAWVGAGIPPSSTHAGLRPVRAEEVDVLKLIFEILISAILHPLAVVLMWITLAAREDLDSPRKVIWAIVGLVWGIGPILYILVGDGALW